MQPYNFSEETHYFTIRNAKITVPQQLLFIIRGRVAVRIVRFVYFCKFNNVPPLLARAKGHDRVVARSHEAGRHHADDGAHAAAQAGERPRPAVAGGGAARPRAEDSRQEEPGEREGQEVHRRDAAPRHHLQLQEK